MSTGTNRRVVALVVAAVLAATACTSGREPDAAPPTTSPSTPRGGGNPDDGVTGLRVRLSEGVRSAPAPMAPAVVEGTPLTDDEVDAVLDRLPEWDVPETDRRDFNRPTDSLGPPRVGDTIDAPFPPPVDPGGPAEPVSGPLEVLRYQPVGDVEVAPFLTVTFNRPMVPLTTLDQLAAENVPVVVAPALDGRWRWIGTRTLRFELDPGLIDRLPAATEYRVDVPAGTRSVDGAELAAPVSWTFATPAPEVQSFTGESDSLPLAPVFVLVFDQRVDPAAVLATVRLRAGDDEQAVRLATEAEIDADESAAQAVELALDGRWVAFRPVDDLPAATAVTIDIGPGTPSAEGPRQSVDVQTYKGRTYAALAVKRKECGGGCVPSTPLIVELTNALDSEAFRADQVQVEPDIPGLRITQYDSIVELSGATAARTTYTVTLAPEIVDVYGQTLGDDVPVTFDVGSARPSMQGPGREYVTTDPSSEIPRVSVTTVNHEVLHVTAWAVEPDDFGAYTRYRERFWSDTDPGEPAWPVVLTVDVDVVGEADRAVETAIDLSAAFAESGEGVVVRVERDDEVELRGDDRWMNMPIVTWVQQTQLAVDAIVDRDELLIWTTDLRTGEPRPDVAVTLLGDGRTVTTDGQGLARVELTSTSVRGLLATSGDDQTLLPSGDLQRWDARDESRWYVFDDRGVYRPGETVRLTGWVRRFTSSTDAQLALYDDAGSVTYRAHDERGNELATGDAELDALGGFHLTFDVPDAANLGQGWIELHLADNRDTATQHPLRIEAFRTPEFEVTARQESAGPFFAAVPATVAVDAEYYAGGPLPDAAVEWTVTTATAEFTPPNWDDFSFGIWRPWWFEGDLAVDECFDCWPNTEPNVERHAGRTDANGTHYLQIDFEAPEVDLPSTVTAQASVIDVNRQAWASRTDLLVHPARLYAGLRSDRPFVEQGTPLRIDTAVTDVDGNPVAGRAVEVTAGRLEWSFDGREWSEQVVDTEECTATSTADPRTVPARCEFSTPVGGSYKITAVVTDDDGRRNRSELTVWVTGGEGRPTRSVDEEQVTIVPDQETYAPGTTAELFVQAPFAPATGLLTVIRGGIVTARTFGAADGSAVVEVPIDDSLVPNVTVQIDMVGAADRRADDGTPLPDVARRPAFATGQIDLSIPPVTRALDVTATPAEPAVEPGADTSVTVAVRDPDGRPVSGADVAVVVVDEAVLAITGYELADPLDVLYTDVYSEVYAQYLRPSVVLDRADLVGLGADSSGDGVTAGTMAAAGTTAGVAEADMSAAPEAPLDEFAGGDTEVRARGEAGDDPIEVRADFEALAVYAPDESTGADGTTTVEVSLPDNLTRYRVMAVAVDGVDRFGKGESTITARLPLMVRPSAPRFLNFGDRFELPVVVQNQTGEAMDVEVAVETANLNLAGTPRTRTGRRVTVPANDRVEVRFGVAATDAGTARVRVAAASGDLADAAAVELPVYTPATTEAFATYGVVDEGAIAQAVRAPDGVIPDFGGLEIGTSSTALQALTDSVLYLSEYRYDSTDGYASRIMAVAALRDVLDAFDAEGLPPPEQLEAQVADDIERLAALQNDDGGFPYWRRGERSIPWDSIQATHALVLARDAGYTVPDATLSGALDHLAEIEEHIPAHYGAAVRGSLSAYALHVRQLAGDRDVAKAVDLYARASDDLELDALAWLWPLLGGTDAEADAEIERTFLDRAVDTAGAATFATDYGEDAYLIAHSDRRTDGIVLDALLTQRPDSDLIPKVVAGLLGNQQRGRWSNVQENSFILLAMKRYFDTFESTSPDFVARAWLGDTYAAEHAYSGRTTDRAISVVPMADVIGAGDADLVVAKDGAGRLYYRLGLRYAPADLVLDARDEGFVVDRAYEAVDDPGDVRRNADGTWRIAAGATVRVRLTMVADARRTHVALVDPLPAGLEPLNPALAVTPQPAPDRPDDPGLPIPLDEWAWCWCWQWFEHQNLRDDRAEAFTSLLSAGTYEYTYLARATTPGTFVVPPTRAEEIYSPEVFGRSPSATVTVR